MRERLTWLIGAILMWMVVLIARPLFVAGSFLVVRASALRRNFRETMKDLRMIRREI
jgi:hypothetical protein